MQLTLHTDYAYRVLIYLAQCERSATIAEIADSYKISRNHLVKVVHELGQHGYIHTERGRGGGITLARPAAEINLGSVARHMEPNFHIVECFNAERNTCVIAPSCALKKALYEAQRAFLKVLDGYHLADVMRNRAALGKMLGTAV